MANVRVIIVNYRTADLTVDCLRSLAPKVRPSPEMQVIVVDNASGDHSAERIRRALEAEGWDRWATLLELAANGGYAAGNNAALRAALQSTAPPDYFLLLNPDTVVRAGALQELLGFLQAHPEVGIAGSRLEDVDGTPQISAFRFPNIVSEFDVGLQLGFISKLLARWWISPPVPAHVRCMDWVAGASMMVRRQVFEDVGLLDTGYFLYFEDVDLCRRAKKMGWSCWYVPQSRVIHFVGQSSGVSDMRRSVRLPKYWFDSRRHYFLKHHGWWYAALADSAWLSGTALWSVRRFLGRKPMRDRPERLSDIFLNSVFVRRQRETQIEPSRSA